jgi:hypothetical protein
LVDDDDDPLLLLLLLCSLSEAELIVLPTIVSSFNGSNAAKSPKLREYGRIEAPRMIQREYINVLAMMRQHVRGHSMICMGNESVLKMRGAAV